MKRKEFAIPHFQPQSYNTARLHSALAYITPQDQLNGLAKAIHDERDRKLAEARQRRQQARRAAQEVPDDPLDDILTPDLGAGYGSAEVHPERRPRGWCEDRTG